MPSSDLTPLVFSRASSSVGSSWVMKVSHLCSPTPGSIRSQSVYMPETPPLIITTLTFLSAKKSGAPPIVTHPLVSSRASTPSSA